MKGASAKGIGFPKAFGADGTGRLAHKAILSAANPS
jgi:hypothetical protein